MKYKDAARLLADGQLLFLDGGVGTELERRGVAMDPIAWCGTAALDARAILEQIHLDYIAAGANVITTNTYASSRLMLEPAGYGNMVFEINQAAISAALQARERSKKRDVLVAGSLSHMCPIKKGTAQSDESSLPPENVVESSLEELAILMRSEGCDLIILEMLYDPRRMGAALRAATKSGLPIWAGFSARRGRSGEVLGFGPESDISFRQIVSILSDFDVDVAGVMHTPPDLIGEAIAVVRDQFSGPLMAYPDSGFFQMPEWQFVDLISPTEFAHYAANWRGMGVQIIGGCCGLSPEHISAITPKNSRL